MLILARSAQELFKSFVPRRGRETAVPYPLDCSADPWTGEVRYPNNRPRLAWTLPLAAPSLADPWTGEVCYPTN